MKSIKFYVILFVFAGCSPQEEARDIDHEIKMKIFNFYMLDLIGSPKFATAGNEYFPILHTSWDDWKPTDDIVVTETLREFDSTVFKSTGIIAHKFKARGVDGKIHNHIDTIDVVLIKDHSFVTVRGY